MSRRTTLWSLSGLMFLHLVCAAQEIQADENTSGETWSCPVGWQPFTDAEPYECLWPSFSATSSYENAAKFCKAQNSHLVTIQSELKWSFVKGMIQKSEQESTWMGLRKEHPTSSVVTWHSRRGRQEILYRPHGFQPQNYYGSYRHMCVIMDQDGYWRYKSCSSDYRMFICERHIECKPGHFGNRCEKQCHCHGHSCDFSDFDVTCPYGCLPGWMGKTCEIKREKASVAYHCIHSGNNEGHVSIEIDTKGVFYRHIQAIDDKDTAYPWCTDTEIYMPEPEKFVNIDIRVTDKALKNMKEGGCAGQEVAGGLYEWRIVLQEWQGIFMPDDQVVMVRCNFSDAETLSRTTGAKVKGKMASAATETAETKEEVLLEVADSATEKKLSSTFVGAPVILKVQFGLSKGSLVKSIFPYDCEATTADGAQRLRLLDSNGCQVEGSPMQPFAHTNNSNIIATPWFPYFTFDGFSEIFFQCSFIFCHDTSCGMGCGNRTAWANEGRHTKSGNVDF